MASTVIAGKSSNILGEKDSALILRGSSIKIQWGNKFIDVVKNGKIAAEHEKILKTSDSIESVNTDGIYLIEENVWAVIDGVKVQLCGDGTTYVSFLTEQKSTAEQKDRALTNIGFYYNTLEEAKNAGIISGIIYVKNDNKLYFIKDGNISEYLRPQNTVEKETPITELYIEDYSLQVGGDQYITCKDNEISVHKMAIFENGIYSIGSSSEHGYRLYMNNGESYLEVDNIIERNGNISENNISIYPIKYYQEENIIVKTAEQFTEVTINGTTMYQIEITLLHSNKYQIGNILTTSIIINKQTETTNSQGEKVITIEKVLVPIDFEIIAIDKNIYQVVTKDYKENPKALLNKSIFYKNGHLPVSRIQDHNYDIFNANTKHSNESIITRIGTITDLDSSILKQNIANYAINGNLGLYSNNSFLENTNIINSLQYGSIFKNFNNQYPKYEEGWIIPDASDDQTIVTSSWVNKKLKNLQSSSGSSSVSVTDFMNLVSKVDALSKTVNILYYGDYYNPVVLMSGNISTNAADGITWSYNGNKKQDLIVESITRIGGRIDVTLKGTRTETQVNTGTKENPVMKTLIEEYLIRVTGVSANQYSSPYTIAYGNNVDYRENGQGAHWFETRFVNNSFSVREFHQENRNNDTWQSGSWSENSCRQISINVLGYMIFTSYYAN